MILTITYIFLQLLASFWSYWGDGNAEINIYSMTQNRYGEEREAQVVLIYVTEPFNLKKQVKTDHVNNDDDSKLNVIKLNRIKKFQTGIYQYNIMSSVFSSIDKYKIDDMEYPPGSPVKISFSSQEWCGLVHHQLNRTSEGFSSISHSYFEAEADQNGNLEFNSNTHFADNLYIDVRELINPLTADSINIYQTLEMTRLFHRPLELLKGEVTMKEDMYVYKGDELEIRHWIITAGKQTWKFVVEQKFPRRILAFEHWDGDNRIEFARLERSKRLPYWKLNKNGDESFWHDLLLSAELK